MSAYGRLWEEHRSKSSALAAVLRKLADVAERRDAKARTELFTKASALRSDVERLEREMAACDD